MVKTVRSSSKRKSSDRLIQTVYQNAIDSAIKKGRINDVIAEYNIILLSGKGDDPKYKNFLSIIESRIPSLNREQVISGYLNQPQVNLVEYLQDPLLSHFTLWNDIKSYIQYKKQKVFKKSQKSSKTRKSVKTML